MQLAQRIGKPYREGFVKNRYVGRTFIMPGQGVRAKSVRQKLNAIGVEFKGRNVLLVDDSIVRGTTSKEIVQMARDAGARLVLLRLNDEIAGSPQNLSIPELTVEHVLPRKHGTGSAWRVCFPDAQEREHCTEALGNLVLVTKSQNDKAGNLDFARKHDAKTMVKGLRVIADFEWEFQMNHLNRVLAPEIETLYLMSSPQHSFISSSGVREIASFGGDVSGFVPANVALRFRDLFPDGRPGTPVRPSE